ncbi:hypothetical protein L3081_07880 [Colwellia sp. MSW7]|uniref:Uncharacterized protein n=1 Tax=Colwellia maritima TaxID=2912588 RepID=A0ABS9WZA9_9GAMM|nr:hypothetical protein [Colwellia maritima]MCI2283334.1 hypothetical protein [Colwellia maritima]
MNYHKTTVYGYLAFAILSFSFAIIFFVADPTLLKPSGGGFGLILFFAVFIVLVFSPVFGSYASLIVYGIIGAVFLRIFIKKYNHLKNGI